ncbi:hypothetical protein K9L63_01665 [Candidatus Gracilibacteria bacterium]|nr:hypothetical protein [Candidatus Gracilibacteria bacterium]
MNNSQKSFSWKGSGTHLNRESFTCSWKDRVCFYEYSQDETPSSCPNPKDDVPLSLKYLEANAHAREALNSMEQEITDENKKKIMLAFQMRLEALMKKKTMEFTGKSEEDLQKLWEGNPEEFVRYMQETVLPKLNHDEEFNTFWREFWEQAKYWGEGTWSGDSLWGTFDIGVAMGTFGTLMQTVGLPFNLIGKRPGDAFSDWGKGVKKSWGVAAIGALLISPPVVRAATFTAGKMLQFNHETAHFVIHPLDWSENKSRKGDFDKGVEEMLSGWDKRLDYFSDTGDAAQLKRILKTAQSFQDSKETATQEEISKQDLEFVAWQVFRSGNVFGTEEWETFQRRLNSRMIDKETFQRFVFADTIGSLGLWLDSHPAYSPDFQAAKMTVAKEIMEQVIADPKSAKQYDWQAVKKFYAGAPESIPENVRLTEKRGIERMLNLGLTGGYVYTMISTMLFVNEFKLVQKGIMGIKSGFSSLIERIKGKPYKNPDKIPMKPKSEKIINNFLKKPTLKNFKAFRKALEDEEIITGSLSSELSKFANTEDSVEELATVLKGDFDDSLGKPRKEVRDVLFRDLREQKGSKWSKIGESILDVEPYYKLKYSCDEMKEVVDSQRNLQGSKAAGVNYNFSFENSSLRGDESDKKVTIFDMKKVRKDEYEGVVYINETKGERIFFSFLWEGENLILRQNRIKGAYTPVFEMANSQTGDLSSSIKIVKIEKGIGTIDIASDVEGEDIGTDTPATEDGMTPEANAELENWMSNRNSSEG